MFTIKIENLELDCIVGILPFERENEQKVIINISFEYYYDENHKAYIDYSEIVSFVEKCMKDEKFGLLEDAILYIRNHIKHTYDICNLKVKISKPNILTNCVVSVEE